MIKWILGFVLIVYWSHHFWNNCTDKIDWRGQTFQVRSTYCSWEGCKSLMDSLEPEEAAKASRAMQEAPIPKRFETRSEYSEFFYNLSFPGYGRSTYGYIQGHLGGIYMMYGVELPNEGADRNALYKLTSGSTEIDGPMIKVAEFIDRTESLFNPNLSVKNYQLLFMSSDGTVEKAIDITSVK